MGETSEGERALKVLYHQARALEAAGWNQEAERIDWARAVLAADSPSLKDSDG